MDRHSLWPGSTFSELPQHAACIPAEKEKKKEGAAQKGSNHAHRYFGRGKKNPSTRIAERQESSAQQKRSWQQSPVSGARQKSAHVGHHHAYKADGATDRHNTAYHEGY